MARIRDEWDKLIELFAEIAIPPCSSHYDSGSSKLTEPWILRTYPNDYSNQEVLSSVPYFVYPCSFKCDVITHFSFVLTNIKSKWTFGYCRHTPDSDTCLVILSDLPWHSTFYKILDHCAELATRKSFIPLERFLESLYTSEIPQPGLQLIVTYTVEDIKLKEFSAPCPDLQKLPSIPEDRNMTEYYNAISSSNMIAIFASMLNERRIVMTSEKLNRLSACVQAANTLIYPMHWQHIFIPLLPYTLIDYLTAPMPFLIGVPQETFDQRVKVSELGDIVLLNVDTNQLTTPFDDVSTIPSDVLHHLRKSFKQQHLNPGLLGDGICRTFLKALVMLIGGYREALCFSPGEKISFDRDAFVSNVRGTSRQLFLENMLQLQIFQQFIESRLDMLNRGERYIDQFEIELNHNEQASNSRFKSQYREWASTMRKEGGALLRAVNPKFKSVFSQGRQAFRHLRQKITAPNHQNNGDHTNDEMDRASSEPSSPKLPPIIKKSISGTFVPTPTSRTVTYVRNPQYLNSSAASTSSSLGLSKPLNHHLDSSNSNKKPFTNGFSIQSTTRTQILNVPNNGVAPSASSESSDIDDNDNFSLPPLPPTTATTSNHSSLHNHRNDVNLREELESIFHGKMDHNHNHSYQRSPGQRILTNNNGDNVCLPIPPPRNTNNYNHRKPMMIKQTMRNVFEDSHNNRTNICSNDTKPQCLIEFDSPPKELPSSINQRSSKTWINHLMFDPLLEDNDSHNHHGHSHQMMLINSSSPVRNVHTMHVSNSNFYIPSSTNNSSQQQVAQPSSIGSSTITSCNTKNPFGWQMFD